MNVKDLADRVVDKAELSENRIGAKIVVKKDNCGKNNVAVSKATALEKDCGKKSAESKVGETKKTEGLLFLNGQPPKKSVLRAIDTDCFIVCADGAYNYLKDYCVPDLIVGDFDSVIDGNAVKAKEFVRLNKDKDITDGHAALNELIKRGVKSIKIFGALGGRIDHEYCNYSLLKVAADCGVGAAIIGAKFDVYLANSKFYKNVKKGVTVSLAPFSDSVHILLSTGLKYKITDEVFFKPSSKGISNIAADTYIGFEITSGAALIFISKERI